MSSGQHQPNEASPPPGPEAQGIAAVLLDEGRINAAQFEAAMREQARSGAFVGDILVEQGVIDEGSLLSFLAKHCRVPHLSLLDYLIDANLASLLPQAVCLKHRLLPIDKLGRNLTVAMVNPLDAEALHAVQDLCPDLRIKPILCAHRHFEMVAGRLFNTSSAAGPVSLSVTGLGLSGRPGAVAAVEAPEGAAPAPEAASPPPAPPEPAQPAKPMEAPWKELEPVLDRLPEVPERSSSPVLEERAAVPPPTDAQEAAPPPPAPPQADDTAQAEDAVTLEQAPADVLQSSGEPEVEDEDEEENYPYAIAVADDEPADAPLTEDRLLRTAFQKGGAVATGAVGAPDAMQDMAHAMLNSLRGTYAILARRMELFRHIPPEHVARIFARGVTMEFEAGQTVFEKGELGDKMFAILIGEVEIFDGNRCLAVLDRGDMFGEMALLGGALRSASARARVNTSVLALDQQAIRTLLPPEVTVQLLTNIVVTLSGRLRDANEQLQALAPPPAPGG